MRILLIPVADYAQTLPVNPRTSEKLMDPTLRAQQVENEEPGNVVLPSIRFEDSIPGSKDMGPAEEKENVEK